jgi:hypothetical protein
MPEDREDSVYLRQLDEELRSLLLARCAPRSCALWDRPHAKAPVMVQQPPQPPQPSHRLRDPRTTVVSPVFKKARLTHHCATIMDLHLSALRGIYFFHRRWFR